MAIKDIRNAKTYNSKPTDYSVKVIIDIRDKLLHCNEWTELLKEKQVGSGGTRILSGGGANFLVKHEGCHVRLNFS